MTDRRLDSGLVALLQRLNGWRLWLLFSLAAVLAALLIVSLMDLALMGRITADYLLTGLVTAGIVAPASLLLMSSLLRALGAARTSAALAEREELYQAIVNQAGEGIDLVDAETLCFVEVNEAACRMLGYDRGELLGQPLSTILPALTAAALRDIVATIVRDGMATFEARHGCKDGHVIDVVVNVRAIQLRRRTCLVGVWHDIGEQKAARLALQESRNLLQAIIDAAPMRVFWKDRELRYLGCNPAFARDAGKSDPDELIGRDDFQMGWSDQAQLYRADDRAVMDSGVARLWFDEPQTTPDGRAIWLRTSKVPLHDSAGRTIGILGVYEDITDRKLAEFALREREEIFSAIVNRSVEGILLIDAQTMEFAEFNDAACEGLGYTRAEFARLRLPDIQGDMSPDQTRDKCRHAAQSPLGLSFENRHRSKDGGQRDRHVSIRPVDVRGRTYLATVWHDVTESKRFADVLQQREQYQRAVLDNFPFMVWLKDEESRFLAVNAAFAKTFGRPGSDSLIGLTDLDIAPPDLAQRYLADDRVVLQGGQARHVEELIDTGERRTWFETFKSRVSIGGRVLGTVGFARDITERKEAEWNLKLAVEVTRVVFWKIDLRSQTLVFDQADLPILGLEREEELRTLPDWLQRMHADDAGPFMERFQAALQPDAPVFDAEFRMRRRDGRHEWIHTKGSVTQRSADGRPDLAVGTSMNITARKQAELELEHHRQHLEELVEQRTTALLATEARASRILDSAADGLYGVDLAGRITFVNSAACRMLGYTADQVVGREAHALFHHSRADGSHYPAAECQTHQAWRAGRESRVDDETYWHADNHPVPVALASHPLVEKEVAVGAVVSMVDVSVQRAAMQAREQALAAAENLARARSEFLANMSHEIRTPMNGVLGFAGIGLRSTQDPAKTRNAFEKILISGNQLLGVVNEILDFSKIDAGKLQIETREIMLAVVLDEAVQLVADRAHAKGLALRLDKAAGLPPNCIGDPLRLGQVLLNLLTNAIKFTERGSVTLSAACRDGQLIFRVADTGIGMTAAQLAVVFNPFQQADGSTTRKFGGTGLGLAICKRLLDLMAGDIRVDSTLGRGSIFEVRLPYVASAPHAAAPPTPALAQPGRPLAGLRILVAEDDEINRAVLEVNLEHDGARLVMVGDGASAVERVAADGATAYDIVLMDIQMPVMDGHEAARRMLELAPELPIIGQTAHAFREDRDRCLAAGMVGHIAKPIDPHELTRLLLQVLAARR